MGYTIDDSASMVGKSILEIIKLPGYTKFRPIAILRRGKTIIPKGETVIMAEDHLYFLSDRKSKNRVLCMVDQETRDIKKIMIIFK